MRVDEAIGAELAKRGPSPVFALQSDDVLRLIYAAREAGCSVYNPRHEAAAVGMADGYARATGGIGVAVIGRGAGLTNGLTAILTASKARSGAVVIAGDGAIGRVGVDERPTKALAQLGLLEAVGVEVATLHDPATAVGQFNVVLERAAAGETIFVDIPIDVMDAEAGDAGQARPTTSRTSPTPEAEQISNVADLLEATFMVRHPLILAGQGVLRSHALDALVKLGDRIGALFATTLKARALFVDNPYDVGICGTYSTPAATDLIVESDLVLAFGASLNTHTTHGNTLLRGARVIQFDRDERAFGRFAPIELGVVGDAGEAASALLAELERRGHRSDGSRTATSVARLARAGDRLPFKDSGRPGALDPRTVMQALNAVLPTDRTIVQDSGHSQRYSTAYLSVRDPHDFFLPREAGALGSASSVALGVAVARPERLTMCCIGDGGFMMHLSDFDTAVRYSMRLLVLVSNNGAYGAELLNLRDWGLKDDLPLYANPSLAEVAKSLGGDGMTVRTMDDIANVPSRIGAMKGPLLIDCHMGRDLPYPI